MIGAYRREVVRLPAVAHSPDAIKSEPYQNFEATLEDVLLLLKLASPRAFERTIRRSADRVHRMIDKGASGEDQRLSAAVRGITNTVDQYLNHRDLLSGLMTIVLVTGVEAYLVESLVLIAREDPSLPTKDTQQVAHNRILRANTIEELRDELRRDWAKSVLSGPPAGWIKRLKALGAPIPSQTREKFGHLWATRNLICCTNRGRADPDSYLKDYLDQVQGLQRRSQGANPAAIHQ